MTTGMNEKVTKIAITMKKIVSDEVVSIGANMSGFCFRGEALAFTSVSA